MFQNTFSYLNGYETFQLPIYPSNANKLEENRKRIQITNIVSILKSNAIDEIAISLGQFEQSYSEHYNCRQTVTAGNFQNLDYCNKLLKLVTLNSNTFLISVDKYLKIVKTFNRYEELKEVVDGLILDLDRQIPNISHTRNSALHVEQRLYQEAFKIPIDYQNEDNEGFLISVLDGITLKYTSEKGKNVGLEISGNTLEIIKQNFEKLKIAILGKYPLDSI